MDTRRDFIYVDDLIEVVIKALNGIGSKGYYHISTGSDYSIKELFDATVKALGTKLKKEVEVKPRGKDDVYTILIDPSTLLFLLFRFIIMQIRKRLLFSRSVTVFSRKEAFLSTLIR